jgi:D-alanyl-D-alanine carboxypeptidase/D-alanyl-D-alanine-endopeptidase (penicillin-binding protein 4)
MLKKGGSGSDLAPQKERCCRQKNEPNEFMKLVEKLIFFGLALGWIIPLSGQGAFQKNLDALVNDPAFRTADFSVSVIEISSGQLVASYQPHLSCTPASSLKVLTTSSALLYLGGDFRYSTFLQYDGFIDADGTLHGNLYLYGTGDPTLGSDQMEMIPDLAKVIGQAVEAVQKAGIEKIQGGIIADASYFEGNPVPSDWEESDLGNYYGAGAWSLNIHENLFYLDFKQSSRVGGKPGVIGVRPPVPGLQFQNQLQSAGRNTGDNAYIYKGPYEFIRPVKGSIPAGSGRFTIKGAVPDAPLFFAQLLDAALKKRGLEMEKEPIAIRAALPHQRSRTNLLVLASPPLKEIVFRANQESVNLYCEALLMTIGKKKYDSGTRSAGAKAARDLWQDRGLSLEKAVLTDGCGMSTSNRVSSFHLAQLLRKSLLDPKSAAAIEASLPLAGRSGTLEGRMKGTAAEGRLRAKTGTMEGVRSYTGIATDKAGKRYTFSLIVNNYKGSSASVRTKLERWMVALCE